MRVQTTVFIDQWDIIHLFMTSCIYDLIVRNRTRENILMFCYNLFLFFLFNDESYINGTWFHRYFLLCQVLLGVIGILFVRVWQRETSFMCQDMRKQTDGNEAVYM